MTKWTWVDEYTFSLVVPEGTIYRYGRSEYGVAMVFVPKIETARSSLLTEVTTE